MQLRRQTHISVFADGSIITPVPKNDFRNESPDPLLQRFFYERKIIIIMNYGRYVDVDILVLCFGGLGAKTNIEHIRIIFKQRPGSIAMVGVCIHNGKPFEMMSLFELLNCDGRTVEITSAAKKISSGVVVAISGEDEGIGDLIGAYVDGGRNRSRR